MGGGVPIVDDVFDFVGDAAGEVGDFVGDVVENVDIEDAIVTFIMTGGNPYATAFAATDFDEDLGFNPASFYDPGSGGFDFGFDNLGDAATNLVSEQTTDQITEKLIENLAKSGLNYGIDSLMNDRNQPSQPGIRPASIINPPQITNPQEIGSDIFTKGLQYLSILDLPELGDIGRLLTGFVPNIGSVLSKNFGTDNLSEVIKKYGPEALQVILAKLSYDDRKRINDVIMGAYNKYNVGTELKKTQYRTGQGLPSLNVLRGGRPLGSQTTPVAPQRTAADVVVRPKAQMGGIMNPMLNYGISQLGTAGGTPLMMAGGGSPEDEMEDMRKFYYNRKRGEMEDLLDEYERFKMKKDFMKKYPRDEARKGGRMKLAIGSSQQPMQMKSGIRQVIQSPEISIPPAAATKPIAQKIMNNPKAMQNLMSNPKFLQILQSIKNKGNFDDVTRSKLAYGSLPMRTNQAGITELDYRQKGGFVPPIGIKEKADDIPAMLSNNEFVFTADAVRAAGGGSVKKGAERMYGLMNKLEGKS